MEATKSKTLLIIIGIGLFVSTSTAFATPKINEGMSSRPTTTTIRGKRLPPKRTSTPRIINTGPSRYPKPRPTPKQKRTIPKRPINIRECKCEQKSNKKQLESLIKKKQNIHLSINISTLIIDDVIKSYNASTGNINTKNIKIIKEHIVINNILLNPSRIFFDHNEVTIYNSSGKGITLEQGSHKFIKFIELDVLDKKNAEARMTKEAFLKRLASKRLELLNLELEHLEIEKDAEKKKSDVALKRLEIERLEKEQSQIKEEQRKKNLNEL